MGRNGETILNYLTDKNGNITRITDTNNDYTGYTYDVQGRLDTVTDGAAVAATHGDITKLVDTAGNVQNSYSYDAFGNTTSYSEKVGNKFRYAGEQYNSITGEYYLRARYYDPAMGRFMNEDTYKGQIENPQSMNLYAYCVNNPVIYIDPSGHRASKKCSSGQGTGNSSGSAWNDKIVKAIKGTSIYKWFTKKTKNGKFQKLFDLGGFYRDAKGIYHAKQSGSLQSWAYSGYNDFYDELFDLATSMNKAKFKFTSDGTDYILWAWKGDYLNLGAGAEMGIYKRMVIDGTPIKQINGTKTEHWLVDQSLAMPMTLDLSYNGKPIISYNPQKDDPKGQGINKWWVTGFNPKYQNVKADELKVTYTVDFSGKKKLYDAFIKSKDYLANKKKWSISEDNKYLLTFTFE